jgi:hypothetical protein
MDNSTPIIINVIPQKLPNIAVETNEGKIYYSDLSSFEKVYCFPKNQEEWEKVFPDSYGLGLIWSSRFEIHIDQIIGLAYDVKNIAFERAGN